MFSSFAGYATVAQLKDLCLQYKLYRACVGVVASSNVTGALAPGWGPLRCSSSRSRTGSGTSSYQSGGSVFVEVDCLVSLVGLGAFRMCCFSTFVRFKSRIHGLDLFGSVGVGRMFGTQDRGGRWFNETCLARFQDWEYWKL